MDHELRAWGSASLEPLNSSTFGTLVLCLLGAALKQLCKDMLRIGSDVKACSHCNWSRIGNDGYCSSVRQPRAT